MRIFTKQLPMYNLKQTRVIIIMGHGKSGKTHRLLKFLMAGGCVTIDEGQFNGFSELAGIAESKNRKVPVVISGLEYWADGSNTPLKQLSQRLMKSQTIESHIYRLDRGKCHYCGGTAEIDIKRGGDSGRQIETSKKIYVPGCKKCWKVHNNMI